MDTKDTVRYTLYYLLFLSVFSLSLSLSALQGNLILWYFKSIVQSGIASFDVKFGMKVSHSYQQQIQRIECMQARQELEYQFPHHTKVSKER